MRKANVLLFSCMPGVDAEGRTNNELTPAGKLKGVIIPVSGEMAGKSFGYDENVSFRFFCKEDSPGICAGNVIRYDGKDYSIVHVADYGKVKVIHINTLIGRNNVRSVVQSMRY